MKKSSALEFLQTARDAMPKGIGDRLYSATMNELMSTAIRCQMAFKGGDMQALESLSFSRSVGVFYPYSEGFYSQACRVGGTYPALWEKRKGIRPWRANLLLKNDRGGRVAPGIAVLLFPDDGKGLATSAGLQVLWCTSLTDDHIVLCRYRGPYVNFREGRPMGRIKLDREQWAAAMLPGAASPSPASSAGPAEASRDAEGDADEPLSGMEQAFTSQQMSRRDALDLPAGGGVAHFPKHPI